MSDITYGLVCIALGGPPSLSVEAERAEFWRMWVTLERELEAERDKQDRENPTQSAVSDYLDILEDRDGLADALAEIVEAEDASAEDLRHRASLALYGEDDVDSPAYLPPEKRAEVQKEANANIATMLGTLANVMAAAQAAKPRNNDAEADGA